MLVGYEAMNVLLVPEVAGGPAAAEGFVEVDDGEVAVADGVGDADAGVEITALGVENVNVVKRTSLILDCGKLHIFKGGVAEGAFKFGGLSCLVESDDSVVDFLEGFKNGLLVGQTCLLTCGDRCLPTAFATAEIKEIVKKRFNVVPDEVEILRPDIVIFLTGSQADNAIMQTFDVDKDAFEPVQPDLFLHRVNLPGVKYAARTIHPSRKGDKEIDEYFDTLIADIKNHI